MAHYEEEDNRIGGGLLGRAILRDPELAFADAIAAGVLLVNVQQTDEKYIGHWMYMYTLDAFDYFKHITDRHYITSPVPAGTIVAEWDKREWEDKTP
jgi:hypothetical protein